MPGVGFEPTRTNTADLKSAPLDHSGMVAYSLPRPYYNYNIPLDEHRKEFESVQALSIHRLVVGSTCMQFWLL